MPFLLEMRGIYPVFFQINKLFFLYIKDCENGKTCLGKMCIVTKKCILSSFGATAIKILDKKMIQYIKNYFGLATIIFDKLLNILCKEKICS